MADDHVANGKLFQHHGRDLASESAHLIRADVLRAEPDIGIQNCFRDLAQRGERRTDHNVGFLDVRQFELEAAHEIQRLGDGLVHLPVPRKNELSSFHERFTCHPGPRLQAG